MPEFRLVTNSVSPNQVRETDDAFIIEDVPFHKPKDDLDGGYTPRANVEQTTAGWGGVPATLFHVRDRRGKPIAAHNDPEKHIGVVEDPRFDGEHVRANFRIEKAELDALGGQADAIREALENGDPLEVSSQYASTDLPPGQYDGTFRTNASAIVRPDSVAILPEGSGRCSIEDGCGINPQLAANADVTVPMTDDPVSPEGGPGEASGDTGTMDANASADGIEYQGTAEGDLDESAIPSDGFESHYVFDADTKSESSFPLVDADGNLRRGNVESAFNLRGHAPDVDGLLDVLEQVNDAFDDPPIDPKDLDEAMTANAGLVSNLRSFLGLGGSTDTMTRGAESPAEPDNLSMEDEDKIEFIVANSDFDRENVAQWEGEQCLDRLYEQVKANAERGEDPTDEPNDDTTADGGDSPDVIELTEEELMTRVDERAEAKAEAMVANREQREQQRDLASTIVANSAEYDSTEAVLEDYPTVPALEAKRDSVTAAGGVPGTGATAGFAANADDDLAEDVSAGVFN